MARGPGYALLVRESRKSGLLTIGVGRSFRGSEKSQLQ